MGILTREELDSRRVRFQYISNDKDEGLTTEIKDEKGNLKKITVSGIEGLFVGIGSHDFEFKDKVQKKLDIFIKDNSTENHYFQIQFGYYTWAAWIILNKILSYKEKLGKNIPVILSYNKSNDNFNWFIEFSGHSLKQKFTRSLNNDVLKFKENGHPDNEKIRNKQIDAWFNALALIIPFNKETIIPSKTDEPVPNEEEYSANNKNNEEDFGDVPF